MGTYSNPARDLPGTILLGDFVQQKENLIFYGGVGTGKTYLATFISLNTLHNSKKVKFFTVASLANN